jgi:hypothetical protein
MLCSSCLLIQTTVTDSATGLSTTTTGQIEMDTARAIVEAMTEPPRTSSSENGTDKNDDEWQRKLFQ